MNQSVLISVLAVSMLAAGCGANVPNRVSRPEHMITDGERYAAAIDEAYDAYEAEVREAAALSLQSDAEADAVVRTLGGNRLEHHLEAALGRRGLSLRGLRVHASHHDGFTIEQRSSHAAQHDRIDDSLARLPSHVHHGRVHGLERPERIAAR